MNEKSFEKIEEYVSGQMNSEDKFLFEAALAADKELADLVNMYRSIEAEMRNNPHDIEQEARLKNSLEKLNAAYFKNSEAKPEVAEKKNKVVRMQTWKQLTVAAGIAGIIVLGIMFYVQNKKRDAEVAVNNKEKDTSANATKHDTILHQNIPSQNLAKQNNDKTTPRGNKKRVLITAQPKTLFADNFIPDAAPGEKEGPLNEAFELYESRNYKATIEAIENADMDAAVTRGTQTAPEVTTFYVNYYKAQCYLAEGDATSAIPELESAVLKSPDSTLQIKTQWYLALAYLKNNDVKNAKVLLQQVAHAAMATEYKQRAIKVLQVLK